MRLEPALENKALAYCIEKHAKQKRKWCGLPYWVHPIRVAGLVSSRPASTSYMVAAAYLHDTIEDCGVTYDELKREFGVEVAKLVLELTTPELSGNRAARKLEENRRLAGISYEAKTIKMCDRLDNLHDMDPKDEWTKKYARETIGLIEAVGDGDEYFKTYLESTVARLSA
jgi:guanosine-3',5'-bis(diphosphate) 3'-pyrophosphohydrolase